MKVDAVLIQLAIVFLPGLIWASLDSRYTQRSKPSEFEYTLRALLFGMTSYAATFALYAALGWPFSLAALSGVASTGKFTPSFFKEVASALGVGLVLAIAWLYCANYKWVSRILQSIGATNTDAEEDVWDFAFNSPGAKSEYVNFRDFDNKLIYSGWVKRFSATTNLRELVLRNVEIYDFDGKRLLGTSLLYLARKPESIHIEFPDDRGLIHEKTKRPRVSAS